jgi:putative flippase GtrA
MTKERKLEFSFIKRTFMYGGAGVCGVVVDGVSFWALTLASPWLPIVLVNVTSYTIGTLVSYAINKHFSFKSRYYSLSLFRFYLTSIVGMVISTSILIQLAKADTGLIMAKFLATTIAVACQYAINSKFSLVPKTKL